MTPSPNQKMSAWLRDRHACHDGRMWARGKSLGVAWKTCPRADWLLWALEEVDRRDVAKDRRFARWFARKVRLTENMADTAERFSAGQETSAEFDSAWAAARAVTGTDTGWNAGTMEQAEALRKIYGDPFAGGSK